MARSNANSNDPVDEQFGDLLRRKEAVGRWYRASQPKKIKNVIAQVMQRRGYAQMEHARQLEDGWLRAAGEELNRVTQVGSIRRGTLEVTVSSSLMLQELTFQKQKLLTSMQEVMPEANIRKLRFRVGNIELNRNTQEKNNV
jgi:predicted nucleic acid-binding Zn ribbon protein